MEHLVRFDISTMPTTLYADYGSCRKPILHVDRTADHDVLLLILTGCMPVVEDGTEYFLKAGDVFFLKKGIHHWGRTPFDENTSWFFIHFRHAEVSDDLPEISPDFYHKKSVHCTENDYKRALTLPKHLHNMLNSDLTDKFKKMVELFNSQNPYLIAYLNTCLHELLVDIYMTYHTTTGSDTGAERTRKMYRFLSMHVNEPFSTEAIEKHMELSYKHLCEIFKKNTGTTLHQCHTNLKMERATRLLCTTEMNISEISEYLGYSDPLYFSNVFKKNTGMSPRAYRQNYSSVL